jgi:hypothetical protein
MVMTEGGQRTGRSRGFGKAQAALVREVVRGSERLAWLVLRAVNRAQARGTTVRLVAPRDQEIVDELGRELGLGPTDEELASAEDYLLAHGYIAPTGLGIAREVYTVTLAGLDWLDRDLTAPPRTSQVSSEEERRSGAKHGVPEPLEGSPQYAEDVGSIIVLRGERDRLLKEVEQQRQRIERLEAELGRRRTAWYEWWSGWHER